jgi:hypothetical protein
MDVASLIRTIHASPVHWDLIKLIGYGAFRFHELASRVKPLVEKHGAKKVSAALFELCSHVGSVTQLNPQGRLAAFSCLGPRPEQWDEYYTGVDGMPQPRPSHHQTPPVVPEPQPDPILDALTRLTATELDMKLRQCRAVLKKDAPAHQRQLAEETIPRIESEMVRRGQEIPLEEKDRNAKRTRKKKG